MANNRDTGNDTREDKPQWFGLLLAVLVLIAHVIAWPSLLIYFMVWNFLEQEPFTTFAERVDAGLAEDPVDYWNVSTDIFLCLLTAGMFLVVLVSIVGCLGCIKGLRDGIAASGNTGRGTPPAFLDQEPLERVKEGLAEDPVDYWTSRKFGFFV